MFVIYDDTYSLRSHDYPVRFLSEPKYNSLVTIQESLYIDSLNLEENTIRESKVVACHKTIRFRSKTTNENLSSELNSKHFEAFEKLIRETNALYISFSGQIPETTVIDDRYVAMNKRDFYVNLKDLIDVYLETNHITPKVLKFGRNYVGIELLSVQSNLLYLINSNKNCNSLIDLIKGDKRFINELNKYNQVSRLKSSDDEWVDFLIKEYSNLNNFEMLLKKITKSFMKYGKCIYSI